VVLIIAVGRYLQIKYSVPGKLRQQMVEHCNAGGDFILPGSIQV